MQVWQEICVMIITAGYDWFSVMFQFLPVWNSVNVNVLNNLNILNILNV